VDKIKILLVSPNQIHRYNWGHQLFRNEISRHTDVIYYGEGYPRYNEKLTIPQVLRRYKDVNVVMTYGLRYSVQYKNIDRVKVLTTHVVIDLFPPHPGGYKGGMKKYKPFLDRNKYDVIFYRQLCQEQYLRDVDYDGPSYWLPFSVDTSIYKKLNFPKKYDVITSSTIRPDVYPNRHKVNNLVKKMRLKAVTKRVVHEKYVRVINESKIGIISTNIFGTFVMKFTEFSSCGTFILTDKPSDMNEQGFKHGQHFVIYKDMNDLKDKIKYFLKNEKEREEIAKNGMELTRKRHNNSVRVREMLKNLKRELVKRERNEKKTQENI